MITVTYCVDEAIVENLPPRTINVSDPLTSNPHSPIILKEEARTWCDDTIGPNWTMTTLPCVVVVGNGSGRLSYETTIYVIIFSTDEAEVAFLLRWAS